MMYNFKDVLTNLGYSPTDCGKELRMRPIYRDSDNSTSLKVDKITGRWIDFGISRKGSFEELIQITLNLKNIDDARDVLNNKLSFNYEKIEPIIKIRQAKIFSTVELENLVPVHTYWKERGISEETLVLFKGGVCKTGKMKNRYVFPIYDEDFRIIGFTGRTLVSSPLRWKHLGTKSLWCYPVCFNKESVEQKREVILVEGIGCMLALWDVGIKNTIVLFGTQCSLAILNYLIKIDPNIIYISLNNEPNNNNIGNIAADKIKNKLRKFFDYWQIKIALPSKKDFADMNKEEILNWKKQNKLS